MSIDYESMSGFGYRVVSQKVSEKLIDDIDVGGRAELPDGIKYLVHGNYIVGTINLLIVVDCDISSVLNGKAPLPDCSPIIEWANKHKIKLENDSPKFFAEVLIS